MRLMLTTTVGSPRDASQANVLKKVSRRAAAAVELAAVAPLLFTLILGIVEFGRAMMVLELLDNSARAGARVGALSGSDTSAVTSAVSTNLTNSGVSGTSTTVKVNGAVADASTATTGDTITVSVSVPASQVSWLPVARFLGSTTLQGSMSIRRE